jgi:hypothetical protein
LERAEVKREEEGLTSMLRRALKKESLGVPSPCPNIIAKSEWAGQQQELSDIGEEANSEHRPGSVHKI